MSNGSNRRKYLRVNDRVALKIWKFDESERQHVVSRFDERRSQFSLVNHITQAKEKHLPQMRIIEKKYAEIAGYLKYIEKQLESLSISILDREQLLPLDASHNVNLSAQGIGFTANEYYPPGTVLEIAVRIFPSMVTFFAISEVVRAENIEDSENSWWLGLHFTHLHEDDREMLIKHNYQLQINTIQVKASARDY